MKVHTIMTHAGTHLDEYVAIFLLRHFGESVFPGVATARVAYWSGGSAALPHSAAEFEGKGVLLVGIGGGRLDEHPVGEDGERKERECAATLTAKALGVDGDPALARILKFVRRVDLEGGSQPFDISSTVKALHNLHPENPQKAFDWAITAIEAIYEQDKGFLRAEEEFRQAAEFETFSGPAGKSIMMAVITSDKPQIQKVARSCKIAILVQRKSSGNVQIFVDGARELPMERLVRFIRMAEMRAEGKSVNPDDPALAAEGTMPGCERWHYFKGGSMLLNGSLTAKNVPPTRLPIEVIRQRIRSAFEVLPTT